MAEISEWVLQWSCLEFHPGSKKYSALTGAGQEPHWQLEDTNRERTMLDNHTRRATCEPSSARHPVAAEAGPTVPSAKHTPSHF